MIKFIEKKIKEFDGWAYVCMFLLCLIVHLVMFYWHGDDIVWFKDRIPGMTWGDLFKRSARNMDVWSSRILVNSLTSVVIRVVVKTSCVVWAILNAASYVLIAKSCENICQYFNGLGWSDLRYVVIGVILIFPFFHMYSAGWLCTSGTYLWPVAVAVWLLSQYFTNAYLNCKFWKYWLYGACILYAGNCEGISVFLTTIFGIAVIVKIIIKKIKFADILFEGLSTVSVMWHLLSPGNNARVASEVQSWFTQYYMLKLSDRIELAFSMFSFEFFFKYNAVYIFFSIVLFWTVYNLCRDKFYLMIAFIPLGTSILFSIVSQWGLYPNLSRLINMLTKEGTITVSNYSLGSSYLPIIMATLVCLSVIISLYIIADNIKYFILMVSVLLGGLGSWMTMLFSPTIHASGIRPFTVSYFSILIVSIMILSIFIKKIPHKTGGVKALACFFAVASVLNSILIH